PDSAVQSRGVSPVHARASPKAPDTALTLACFGGSQATDVRPVLALFLGDLALRLPLLAQLHLVSAVVAQAEELLLLLFHLLARLLQGVGLHDDPAADSG